MDIVTPVWSQLVHVTKISAPTNNFLSVINNSSYSPPHLVTSVPISGGHCESSHCIFQGRSGRSMLAALENCQDPQMLLLLVFWLSCCPGWQCAAVWDVRQSCEWGLIYPGPHEAVLGFGCVLYQFPEAKSLSHYSKNSDFPCLPSHFCLNHESVNTKADAT